MTDREQLRALRDERFPELPLDCGQRTNPGIVDTDEWRDWSAQDSTPDQLRIESYLARFDLHGKSILHIGIGNSGLALRFCRKAAAIVGTTVIPSEVSRARELGIANYKAVLHNKHSGENAAVPGAFDFIVDNNPTTFCCCMVHLANMLEFYASRLGPRGQLVTDRVGLSWTTDAPGANCRWGFSFDDLAAVAALVDLRTHAVDDTVLVVASDPTALRPSRWSASYLGRLLVNRRR